MPRFRMFKVIIVFSDGLFAEIPVNCSNSVEAIKAALSMKSVVEKLESKLTKREIVKVECSFKEWQE